MTTIAKTHRIFAFGQFRLDLSERLLLRDGKVVPLAPKLFDTLALLVENNGRVIEKSEMLDQLWRDTFVDEGSMSQNIFQLRKILRSGSLGPNYIETISKRGYRFNADIDVSDAPGNHIRFYSNGFDPLGTSEDRLRIRSLAVMPFAVLGGLEEPNDYLGLGMADATIIKLSSLGQLTVMPTRTMLKYVGRFDDLHALCHEHNIDAVLEGTIQRSDDRIRVTVQLISSRTEEALWSGKFDERFTDIFAVQDSISEKVADALSLELTTGESQRLKKHGTQDTKAYQAYLMGLFFSNKRTKEGIANSIEYFRQAIEADPSYALAYAGLADSFFWIAYNESDSQFRYESFERSRSNALRAIELDPMVAEAHAALATVKIKHDRNPASADASFRKAIAADASCAMAYSRYTYFLAAMGRINEAHEMIKRAQEIDPLSPDANASLAMIFYFLRDYNESIRFCQVALALEPHFAEGALIMGRCFEAQERFENAAAQYQKAKDMNPSGTEPNELLAHLHAITNLGSRARKELSSLLSPARISSVRPYNVAAIYAALGEAETAFEWLDKPFTNWTERLRMLRFDPRLDPLRADERYPTQDLTPDRAAMASK